MVLSTSCQSAVERFKVAVEKRPDIYETYYGALTKLLEQDQPSMKDAYNLTQITLRLFSDRAEAWSKVNSILEKAIDLQVEERLPGVVYLVRACFLYMIKFPHHGSSKVLNFAETFIMHEFDSLSVLQKFEIFETFFYEQATVT